MRTHLSAHEVDAWIIGESTSQLADHVRECPDCAAEVERAAGPLLLFGGAVRAFGQQQMRPMGHWTNARNSGWTGLFRFGMAVAVAAMMLLVAVPVYRHGQNTRQAVQDEALLRQVQSELQKSVPAPMEPLAKLMPSDLYR